MGTFLAEVTLEPPVHGPRQPARRPPGEVHQVPLAPDHDQLDVAAQRPQCGEHLLALPDRAVAVKVRVNEQQRRADPVRRGDGGGSLAVAHRPNEWIPVGDLGTAIDLTEALVRGYTTA